MASITAMEQRRQQPTGTFVGARGGAHQRPATAGGGGRRRVLLAYLVVAVVLLNGVLLWMAPADLGFWPLAAASGTLWLCAVPSLIFFVRPRRQVPFLQAVSVVYFMYYGWPIFTDAIIVRGTRISGPEVVTASGLAFLGAFAMLLGYYGPLGWLMGRLPQLQLVRVRLRGSAWWFIGGAAAAFVIALPGRYHAVPASVATVLALVWRAPLVLLGGAFLLHLRGQLDRSQKVAWLGVYGAYLLAALGTGLLAQVMTSVVPLMFLYVVERGRIPLKALLAAAILITPFIVAKAEYRRELAARPDMSIVERAGLFLSISYEAIGDAGFLDDAQRKFQERASYFGTLSYVVSMTPRRIPYWNGETYDTLLWTFVPRAIAPDKPEKDLGQRFGHRYGLLDRTDRKTSYNFAQLVEMYANFGAWGVGIGMFLVGVLYRALYALINHGRGGDGPTLVAAVLFALLLNIESDASLVLMGTVPAAVVLVASLFVVSWLSRRWSPAPSPS